MTTYFLAELYWPSETVWIVRAMTGPDCITAASGSDPWDAAARCCRFMRERMKGTR